MASEAPTLAKIICARLEEGGEFAPPPPALNASDADLPLCRTDEWFSSSSPLGGVLASVLPSFRRERETLLLRFKGESLSNR